MYDNIKQILKGNLEYIMLHTSTNDNTKNKPNEVLDKILGLKTFVMNVDKNCIVIKSKLNFRCDNKKSGFA